MLAAKNNISSARFALIDIGRRLQLVTHIRIPPRDRFVVKVNSPSDTSTGTMSGEAEKEERGVPGVCNGAVSITHAHQLQEVA